MNDKDKTKAQLVAELQQMRSYVSELEQSKSEREQEQLKLQDSEEKYRMLVENINDAIVISQNNKFIFFNNRFPEMLGYTAEELYKKNYKEIYTAESVRILKEREKRRKLDEDVPSRYETVFHRNLRQIHTHECLAFVPHLEKGYSRVDWCNIEW